jgi:two-component system response regulator MprA
MKILIVDDEPDMVKSLARILKSSGFEVESASDGEEAVAKNLSWEPEAVLMDIRMPRLNGIDACLKILRDRPEVLVILMTGFSDALDEANQSIFARACENSRVEVMMKPLDLDRVTALLNGETEPATCVVDSVVAWQNASRSKES